MPELPEVETVKKKLRERLLNRVIEDVNIYWQGIIADSPIKDFNTFIKQQEIIDITRRGKWLLLELKDYYLSIHLRMEGKFFFREKDEERNKHEHIIFHLDNNLELRYHDTRKFGKMNLIKKDNLNDYLLAINLGLEPFDEQLTVDYLKDKLKGKRISIKTTLLDQHIIAGIGNIYANEILFLSKINPEKPAYKVSSKELESIIINTREVLKKAIEKGGTTIRSYFSLDNKKGEFQDELFVHQRQGQPCLYCDSIIEKKVVGGRGTYFCPSCQK